MLQSIVANTIVKHALHEEPAPVIVGTSTNNQAVTNIIDSFSSVVPDECGTLDFRWLSLLENGKASETTLSGIAAYCPSKRKLEEAEANGFICEQQGKSRAYSNYSSPAYTKGATEKFLNYARKHSGRDIQTLSAAKKYINGRLKQIDIARRNVIKARIQFEPTPIFSYIQESEAQEKKLNAIKAEYAKAQQLLKKWNRVKPPSGIRGAFKRLMGKEADQSTLIAETKNLEETIPSSIHTTDDVICFYRNLLENLKREYNLASEKAQIATRQRKNAEMASRRFDKAVELADSICAEAGYAGPKSFKEELGKHTPSIPSQNSNLLSLDKALDTTLRYIEFWLAIHYYECEWLIACKNNEIIAENERYKTTQDKQDLYWFQAAALTPCFVMTEYQIPKYFKLFKPDESEPKTYDFGRIDLLITDEAGQVNTPIALASFALAQKAVVVGDTHQLAPIWALDEEKDRRIAASNGLPEQNWSKQKEAGLTCSSASSLMKTAIHSCKWRYSKEEAGLFLEEHYRCVEGIISFCNELIYHGRLIPSRENPSKLANYSKPFLYSIVPESQNKRVGSSRCNQVEADAIVSWIVENSPYLQEIYDKDAFEIIGVVAPFAAQASLIRKTLKKIDEPLSKMMTIGTAHKLQGDEKPVILFSATYGNNSESASFINNNPELMNVAVSRAKDLLVVFGAEKWLKDKGKVFKVLSSYAEKGTLAFGDGNRETSSSNSNEQGSASRPPLQSRKGTTAPSNPFSSNTDIQTYSDIWIEREQEGYSSITKFEKSLKINGAIKRNELNNALCDARLIQKIYLEETREETWFPTAKGFACGIRETKRTHENGESYAYPMYSEKCAEAITDAFNKYLTTKQ